MTSPDVSQPAGRAEAPPAVSGRLDSAARLIAALLRAPMTRIVLREESANAAGRWSAGSVHESRPDLTDAVLQSATPVRGPGYLGVPMLSSEGSALGAIEVLAEDGRVWSETDEEVLHHLSAALSDHVETLQELQDRISHLDLGFDAAGIGTWDWDLGTGSMTWDERLHRALGTSPRDVQDLGTFSALLHPDDLERVTAALERAVREGTDFIETFRMLRPDGEQLWIESRGRRIVDRAGRPVRVLGVAYDISESRAVADQLIRVLDAMGSGFITIAADWQVAYANVAATRVLRRSRDQLVGRPIDSALPPDLATRLRGSFAHASGAGEPISFQIASEDGEQWLEAIVHPNPDGLAVVLSDITEQRRINELATASLEAREQAVVAVSERQAAQARFERLANAGEALAPALDLSTALEVSLDLVVPSLADCAVVHLGDGDDPLELHLAAVRHPDPAGQEALIRVFGTWTRRSLLLDEGADAEASGGTAIGRGRPITIDGAFIDALASSEQDRRDLESLHVTSGVIVPLLARGRTLGMMALGAMNGRTIPEGDMVLIEQLATRMAVALDNARLFADAQAARQTAEAASAQLALLSEASQSLGATLDVREAVGRLARLVVPVLADWSLVTLVDEDGELVDVGRWHRDPAKLPLVDAYATTRIRSSMANAPVRQAVRTRRPVIITDVDEAMLVSAISDPGVRDIARDLRIGTSIELPLVARGRVLGAITLLNERGRRPLTDEELATAREVASRAAVALDNAQTFARQRRVAEELQHSMLTNPPEPDHIQIAVRYLPAAPTVQVGGDWYDAFLDRDGNTVIVIGDVMGHDISAAAAMGQIRSLVRGIAFDRHESPSQVLARVDGAMAGLAVGALATALIARIEQSSEEAAAGVRRITWCSAGHPGPLLVTPAGDVRELPTPPGMLLGVDPTAQRRDNHAMLDPDSTVVLFTDGLFERRSMSLDAGLELVRRALGDLAAHPLNELCDGLLSRMLPTAPEDDVALVAVRLFDQTAARPDEAGARDVPKAFDDPRIASIGAPVDESATLDVAPDQHAPSLCRRFLEQRLAAAFPNRALDDAVRFDVDLVATELVTNALRVAAGPLRIAVRCFDSGADDLGVPGEQGAWVRIAVTDDGPGAPELGHAALTDTRGRGLSIIAALSKEWGFERSNGTKTVWARLAV